ncbi:hypothetical protein EDB85DRAFT_1891678 [Lactarius pseudohatsudake]|nr:hypothetical protein EDB85DRAFT_1891678 [Lactarius pseudohatsudake]
MVVILVQVTTVNQLIKRVKKGKFWSHEDILAQSFLMSNGHQGHRLPKIKTGHCCRSAEDDLETPLSYSHITMHSCPGIMPAVVNTEAAVPGLCINASHKRR